MMQYELEQSVKYDKKEQYIIGIGGYRGYAVFQNAWNYKKISTSIIPAYTFLFLYLVDRVDIVLIWCNKY